MLLSLLVFGSVGLLVEVYFTGFFSAIVFKDRRAMSTTSLWMLPVYGTAAVILGFIHDHTRWPFYLAALPYTLFIYVWEFSWHWILGLFKVKVWDYGPAKFTLAGRVQPRYFPWWYLLACGFNPLHSFLLKVLNLVARYG